MTTATAKLRDEVLFPNNDEAAALLMKYVDEIVRGKQKNKSYGTSTIEITWEAGAAKLARIRDETTYKFGEKRAS